MRSSVSRRDLHGLLQNAWIPSTLLKTTVTPNFLLQIFGLVDFTACSFLFGLFFQSFFRRCQCYHKIFLLLLSLQVSFYFVATNNQLELVSTAIATLQVHQITFSNSLLILVESQLAAKGWCCSQTLREPCGLSSILNEPTYCRWQ